MANNLFISYDLYNPGQDYQKVITAVKSLGNWAKVQKSFWYVKSTYTASQAVDIIWPNMDTNDSLIVVDATNKNASWRNVSNKVSTHIINHWQQ